MGRYAITGAGRGIGAALAQDLLSCGHHILAIDLVKPEYDCEFLATDLSDLSAVTTLIGQISEPLDGFAHVAGLPGTKAKAAIMSVNYCAARALCEGLLPAIKAGGSIALVSSISAQRVDMSPEALEQLHHKSWSDLVAYVEQENLSGTDAYQLSKRLLHTYLPHLVGKAQHSGVRALTISPGPVQTAILDDFKESMGAARIDKAESLTGRHALPEEVADVCAFAMSDKARWVNGVDLQVDGGMHALRQVSMANPSPN